MKTSVCSMALALALAGAARADVQINIGIPGPPPIVVHAPPRLLVVPTTPAVRYAPDLGYNLFGYGGRYYTFHEGAWFVAPAYTGPWNHIEVVHVPRAVRIVPACYYRVPPRHVSYKRHPHGMPPGQAKKLYGSHPRGHGKHHGHHH